MPRSKQRNSLLNTRVSESAKWRRENAKYVKYPKTSSAHGAEQLLQRESWCTQQRRVWADTHLTMAVLPRHTALTAHRFCRGVSTRNPGDSSVKQCSLTEKKRYKSVSSAQNERAEENAQRRGDENTRTRKSFVARAQTPPTTQNSSAVGETQQKNSYFKNYVWVLFIIFKK